MVQILSLASLAYAIVMPASSIASLKLPAFMKHTRTYDDLGPEYSETYEPAGYCTANQWECLESKDGYLVQGDTITKSPFVLGGDPWCERAIARNYNCDPFLGNGANPTDEICFQNLSFSTVKE